MSSGPPDALWNSLDLHTDFNLLDMFSDTPDALSLDLHSDINILDTSSCTPGTQSALWCTVDPTSRILLAQWIQSSELFLCWFSGTCAVQGRPVYVREALSSAWWPGTLSCCLAACLLDGGGSPAGQLQFNDYVGLLLAELLLIDHFLVVDQQAQCQISTVFNLLEWHQFCIHSTLILLH